MYESYFGALYSFLKLHLGKKMTSYNKVRVQYPECYGIETAKETLMFRTVLWTLGEGECGKIWENGIETCILSCMK